MKSKIWQKGGFWDEAKLRGDVDEFDTTRYFGVEKKREMDKLAKEMIRLLKGKGDLVVWMKKLKLVAKFQKISDLASFIPLFLEGDVFALYLDMSEEDQQDEKMIEVRLKEAYMEGPFEVYEKLKKIT